MSGLELLASLADSPERTQQELDMHLALGPALMMTKDFTDSEERQCLRMGSRTLSTVWRPVTTHLDAVWIVDV
jgi:hypothetical protein